MKNAFLLLASIIVFASCDREVKEVLPSSSGTHNEMMLVIDEGMWEGELGNLLRKDLEEPVNGLPNAEPLFIIHQVDQEAFGDFFERYKSIVQFAIIPDSTGYSVGYNQWASPQIVVSFIAPSKLGLAQLFKEKKDQFINTLQKHDRQILLNRIRQSAYSTLPPALAKVGIKNMVLPDAFTVTQEKDSLIILYSQYRESNRAIFIHTRPISELAPGSDMISVRDTILKYNFEGPSEGSYPGTEMRIPPILTTTSIDGKMAFELRGLWRTYNDFMGGSFLSYAIYDEEHNRIVTVESFMYGVKAKKYKVMQELEAILRSVELN
ncbi:DUF4837 family protein [Phaeocystidibacter marisrubri]|uniref:DUF4837 family protein n=1 Tax=Phaeocystidibacter marisrubri TaxID=1577780 RepID=A0A6L3ZHC8_9FLAO|nr:DUF4837 family protein [Phaeocystidibacter marisrubri]KAB2816389.1 DUF4837 family protein [Phaeocystidibacter marisrubri]GGH68809.1 DUF4837 domain-containing protein [Phaeocystidibacter marisrubri]